MGFMNPDLITRFDIDPAKARQNALVNQGLQQGNQLRGMQIAEAPEERNYLLQQREQAAQDKPIQDARAGAVFLSRALPTIPDVQSYYGQRDALIGKFGVPEELLPDQATIQGLAAKNGIDEQAVFERIQQAYNPQDLKTVKPGWSAPKEGVDENGKPIVYRVNDAGEIDILSGIRPKPTKGMKIYDREGNLMVDMSGGDGPDLDKATIKKIEGKVIDGSEQLARMDAIYKEFKPEYQEVGTRFKAAWTGTKAFLGVGVEEKDRLKLTEFKGFQRKAIENINLYIKELTGAQMSEKEADRLRLAQPDPGENWWQGDDPITFKAKMDDVLKTTRAAVARWRYYKSKQYTDDQIQAMINKGDALSLNAMADRIK